MRCRASSCSCLRPGAEDEEGCESSLPSKTAPPNVFLLLLFLLPNLKSSDPSDSDSGDITWRQFSGLRPAPVQTAGFLHRFIDGAELPNTSKHSRGGSLSKIWSCWKRIRCLFRFIEPKIRAEVPFSEQAGVKRCGAAAFLLENQPKSKTGNFCQPSKPSC